MVMVRLRSYRGNKFESARINRYWTYFARSARISLELSQSIAAHSTLIPSESVYIGKSLT